MNEIGEQENALVEVGPYLAPLAGRVLVVRDEMAEKSPSGKLYLPMNRKTADENREMETVKGMVLALGPEVEDLEPGDRIVYRWFTGDELKINGHRCVMLQRTDVLATLTEGDGAIVPLDSRVVVRQDPAPTMSAGGLALASAYQDKPLYSTIIAVGPGRKLKSGKRAEVEPRPGDRVIIRMYGGNAVTVDGVELSVLRDDELMAKVEEE